MMTKKSDDAVSPVVGVMLMVVITVVIAGVIAAFGTGMAGSTESAPSVVLDVEIINYDRQMDGITYPDLSGPDFRITHVSGITLDTGDFELRFSWTSKGTKYHSTYSASSFSGDEHPMFVETAEGNINFGDAELNPGYMIHTRVKFLGNVQSGQTEHKKSKYMDYIFNNGQEITEGNGIMDALEKGTKVDVSILHIPSNSIIYDKAVYVI
ncbi:MAG: type IV pilin N-terminal domain-containing protein [Methanocorpusculaceae archaeon]|nr:type IV pilin N-terminal domain-containing protein [Methanocorpusculaceae archaeon]